MKAPTPPSEPASVNPDPWETYFEELRLYEKHLENKKYAEYRRNYYKKRTEQRQIKKMHELMDKYPNEAKAHVYSK